MPRDKTGLPTDKKSFARDFMRRIPHSRELGMEISDMGDGTAEITMAYDKRFVGDPKSGVIHGGAVSALMDTCCGTAVISHPEVPGPTATIDLRIEYMRAATPGQIVTARAECYHVTRSVAFVRATTFDEDFTRPVATATGTFTVEAK